MGTTSIQTTKNNTIKDHQAQIGHILAIVGGALESLQVSCI